MEAEGTDIVLNGAALKAKHCYNNILNVIWGGFSYLILRYY